MGCANQADNLQGSRGVNGDILAANDMGIDSDWQQSKQNRALPVVVGKHTRMICNDLCWVQLAPLLPFFGEARETLQKPNVGQEPLIAGELNHFLGFPSGIIR